MTDYIKSKGWIYNKNLNKGYGAYQKDNFYLVNLLLEGKNYIGIHLINPDAPIFTGEVNTPEQFDKLELLIQNKL